jgi:hypothetical protein
MRRACPAHAYRRPIQTRPGPFGNCRLPLIPVIATTRATHTVAVGATGLTPQGAAPIDGCGVYYSGSKAERFATGCHLALPLRPLSVRADMNRLYHCRLLFAVLCLVLGFLGRCARCTLADERKPQQTDPSGESEGEAAESRAGREPRAAQPEHESLLKDTKTVAGMWTLYHRGNRLLAELKTDDYEADFIVLISIARGIGRGDLVGGYSWSTGDDWVWQLRKVDDRVHVIRRNVRFKAEPGTPAASAVQNAYTDSVLFSLPILAPGRQGGDLVDLSPVFMSDLPQIGGSLPGFMFAPDKSTWAAIKGFKDNVQLQVAATYASDGHLAIESVADSRGVTVNVHYSISKLPGSGYQPRLADDRVGYFVTVVKDFSSAQQRDRFMRYINRWHLQKADASAKLSPPKKPLVFWIEKTVPFPYRPAIRAGMEEWNKAFEAVGIANAIEVRQQPDDAVWDPEDVNFNTFRWITAGAGFAMGPSRVNPYTGEILDADIIFDADFIQFWSQQFETLTPQSAAEMAFVPHVFRRQLLDQAEGSADPRLPRLCRLARGMSSQMAAAATVLSARMDAADYEQAKEKLILQGLKEVTMHEVGHTLGLRHNFKASSFLRLEDLRQAESTPTLSASVMDYNPTNIVPRQWKQGDYYMNSIGPYDYWAVEYGYKPLDGGTQGELKALQAIAARSGEPGHAFATDEDVIFGDVDPDANLFDFGDDALLYARWQAEMLREAVPGLVDRVTDEGEDYAQVRRSFNVLLSRYGQNMYYAARIVGGLHTSRSHKGDAGSGPPLRCVEPARQREALCLLEELMFGDEAYEFPGELYSYLVPSRWLHWGMPAPGRPDFPMHEYVLMWQQLVLQRLLSNETLRRMHDVELIAPAEQDVLTTAELIERVTRAVFAEVDRMGAGEHSNRRPAISSLRRNLQRALLAELSRIALGDSGVPYDCRTVVCAELQSLAERIKARLDSDMVLDSYTRAHLQETSQRIEKVLGAQFVLPRP